jgi:predicted Zn-dependent protease
MISRRFVPTGLVAACILALTFGATVSANHSWSVYHWARTTNSFDLTVINSTTSDWDLFVAGAVADWSQSNVLDMVEDTSGSTDTTVRRRCKAPSGMVRICNLAYGFNGWLGIAGISIDPSGHIISGYTKLNDSYFSQSYANGYYDDVWKQSVACQELGHNIGLDHQDEDFDNTSLHSCMDYQDPPYEFANAHDFDQLETIYGHLDSYNSYSTGSGGGGGGGGCGARPGQGCNKLDIGDGNSRREWGLSLGRRGAQESFIRIDPDGTRHITFVTWVAGN